MNPDHVVSKPAAAVSESESQSRRASVVFWLSQLLLLPMLATFIAALIVAADGPDAARTLLRFGGLVAIPALGLAAVMAAAASFTGGLLSRGRLRLVWVEIAVALALLGGIILLARRVPWE
ncbi:MAG: hypothetical protein ACE14L_08910 [Terriglobales bacterium]